jgi:hypothetical protein
VSFLALLISAIILVSCVGSAQFFGTPIAIDHLEGNYVSLASCTFEQLARRHERLVLMDREQYVIRIAHTNGLETQWELSFVNEDGGRQTRLEVKSMDGSFPSEHALALARACAA